MAKIFVRVHNGRLEIETVEGACVHHEVEPAATRADLERAVHALSRKIDSLRPVPRVRIPTSMRTTVGVPTEEKR